MEYASISSSASSVQTINTGRATPQQMRLRIRPIIAISAQNLAKAARSVAERSRLAARWVNGLMLIDSPTTTLAATIFNVSHGSVHRAQTETTDNPATTVELLSHWWHQASDAERDQFTLAHLLAVWDLSTASPADTTTTTIPPLPTALA